MYIYERKAWPNFFWNEKVISESLITLRYLQGQLIGGMRTLGFDVCEAITLQNLTQEVVKSNEIEGDFLDKSLVRSSVARHLGIKNAALHPKDRSVDGVVEMVLDATQNFDKSLTKKRVLDWHTLLFPKERKSFTALRTGKWRKGPVEVISGHMGKEIIHFEGPPSDQVDGEMELFLDWINGDLETEPLVKSAIAHLWFVTIHPFEDGNGRIGRAIADLLLARSEKSSRRFYSLSAQIQIERKNYYAVLERTQKGTLDITLWIKWFLDCLESAIKQALETLKKVISKNQAWGSLKKVSLNKRQEKILDVLLGEFKGKLTSSKWAKMAKCLQIGLF